MGINTTVKSHYTSIEKPSYIKQLIHYHLHEDPPQTSEFFMNIKKAALVSLYLSSLFGNSQQLSSKESSKDYSQKHLKHSISKKDQTRNSFPLLFSRRVCFIHHS